MESYRQPNPSSEFQAQREDTTPKFTPPEQASNPHAGEGVVGEGQTDAELIDQDPFDRMLGLSPNETKPGAGEIFDGLSFDTSDKAVLPAGGVIGQIPERTDHEVGQDPEQASDLHPDEGVAREEQADAQLHDEDVDQDPFDRMLGLSPNETKPGAGEIFDGLSFDTSDKGVLPAGGVIGQIPEVSDHEPKEELIARSDDIAGREGQTDSASASQGDNEVKDIARY